LGEGDEASSPVMPGDGNTRAQTDASRGAFSRRRPRVVVCKWYLAEKRMSVRNRYGIVRDLSGRDVGQEGGMGPWRGQVSSNVAQWLSATSSLVLFFILP
jgi:hypothetical protein